MERHSLIDQLIDLVDRFYENYGVMPDKISMTRWAYALLFRVVPVNSTLTKFRDIPVHIIKVYGTSGNLFITHEATSKVVACSAEVDSIAVLRGLPLKTFTKETMSKDAKSTYYDVGGIEVQDVIKAKLTPEQYQGFLLGNALKYLLRANFKHETPDRDFEKANNMTSWLTQDGVKAEEKRPS